jgi:hypothetical protein
MRGIHSGPRAGPVSRDKNVAVLRRDRHRVQARDNPSLPFFIEWDVPRSATPAACKSGTPWRRRASRR